ncbi:5-hydroxyisourate hydrolase [Vibrio crassostreae]|uniref:hydroxyisourate hydrolase n=1 Tax=Vibrio crassostreae TaxID=246167 RepID=UPI001B3175AB|nr:hydroxyisourate hydrolase [Vibrio crassostreae]CAK2017567.1 5-hydroxyisourate hydrolase [Vibrio crassostreae]CAK2020492.1 5-hydroxyisourate hydrolase [Vibrio crassostreae]CAK2022222.1 5-hydroxyisourate hydrolase [Vibrio crassostreae]CAK2022451.1 5-hydroxyisourate hydrolase [Vibrio crassostreae]CAK2024561.1 5-hydroxyisourate hydrolase [Vibrio crassostreae]
MGRLTTHVLDTTHGLPGTEIKVELYKVNEGSTEKLATVITNSDGRTDAPILAGNDFRPGKYQLVFYVADYYKSKGVELDGVPFLDDVVIRFGLDDPEAHYHVPLLVSPYSFSTYRGS